MAKQTATTGNTYLYAVVDNLEKENLGPLGLYESEVYTISDGNVTAIVSDLPKVDKLRPERRHLAAHQQVLSQLVEQGNVVLPVSFGTVADSGEAVRSILSRYSDELVTQIQKLQGRVEMELRVTLDVPNTFEYLVLKHSDLKEMRDRLFGGNRVPDRDEKIELGQMFERLIEEDREAYRKKVEKVLSSVCTDIRSNKCRNEQEMIRLSCLIERAAKEKFEEVVKKASEQFDDNFSFEIGGPYPPYNFVDVRVKV